MRLTLALPFGIVLLSRATYTPEEAKDAIVDMPVGFEIISDEEAHRLDHPIEFPIVEVLNAGSSQKKRS